MIWLILSICCSAAVALLLKYSSVKRIEQFPVFTVNYFIALSIGLFSSKAGNLAAEPSLTMFIALGMGISYVLGFFVFQKAIASTGTGIATAVSRLSVTGPLLVSIFVFRESVGTLQGAGLVLAILLLPFSSKFWPPWKTLPDHSSPTSSFIWSFALYTLFALNDSLLKIRTELFPQSDPGVFFGLLFAAAFVVSLGLTLFYKQKFTSLTWVIGIPLGLTNFGTAYFLSRALENIQGFQVFTSNSVGIIGLTLIVSRILFEEKLGKHNYVFITGSLVALVLLRLP